MNQRAAYLHVGDFLVLIQQAIQVPLACKVLQAAECERLRRAIRADIEKEVEVRVIFAEGNTLKQWLWLGRTLCLILKDAAGIVCGQDLLVSRSSVAPKATTSDLALGGDPHTPDKVRHHPMQNNNPSRPCRESRSPRS